MSVASGNSDSLHSRTTLLAGFRELPAIALILSTVAWLALTKASFRSPENLAQVGQEAAFIGIMACGQALVILTGGIDLSVGSMAALSACVMGERMMAGWPPAVAVAFGLAAGALAGFLNGSMITYRRLPPILVTLATLLIYRAITNIATKAVPYSQLPDTFLTLGRGFLPFVFFVLIAMAFGVMQARSRFGRRVVAVGGSEQAARLSGVPVDFVLRRAYLFSGLCAAMGGALWIAASDMAQWNLAEGYELEVIAAVVIGGVRLTGGEGSVVGAALGAVIIVIMRNALFLSGVPTERYGLITGAVILFAALVEQARRARAGARI